MAFVPEAFDAEVQRFAADQETDPTARQERLNKALELSPKNQLPHFYLGIMEREKGNGAAAVEELTKAVVESGKYARQVAA